MSRSSAAKLIAVMHKVRELDPEMPAQTLLALLEISSHENFSQQDLREALNVASSTSARIAARLSEWERFPKQPGLSLVNNEINPMDRRLRLISLSAKGKAFVNSLLKELE
jgi:DNA-binding MarR family transcriptional regulator